MKRLVLGALALLAVLALAAGARGHAASPHAGAPRHFGATFSPADLQGRGLDWRAALDAGDELGLDFLRVPASWDRIEPKEGQLDFAELDELIERAAGKNYSLLLTVGMKAPRWPEYHLPGWAQPQLDLFETLVDFFSIPFLGQHVGAEVSTDPVLRQRTLDFVKETVRHVKGLPSARAVVAYQVENEPMDKAGPRRWWLGADLVAEEAALIRAEDPGRPLVVNCWCEDQRISSFPWGDGDYATRNALAIGDVIGLDTYWGVGDIPANQLDAMNRCVNRPRKVLARAEALGKDAWIVESQAEGWGSYQPTPDDVRWLVHQHESLDFKTILLWGFETWYEKKVKKGDTALWDVVEELASGALPVAGSAPTTCTVQQGENLAAVARRLGIALAALAAANPQVKDPNALVAGQVLSVP